MNPASALDGPTFKALDGSEIGLILRDHIAAALEVAFERTGEFNLSRGYPVASIDVSLKIRQFSDPTVTWPMTEKTVSIRFASYARPDEKQQGLQLLAEDIVPFTLEIGRGIESAPDKLRELHDIPLSQPQLVNEQIVDVPSEVEVKTRRRGFLGASKRIAAEREHEKAPPR